MADDVRPEAVAALRDAASSGSLEYVAEVRRRLSATPAEVRRAADLEGDEVRRQFNRADAMWTAYVELQWYWRSRVPDPVRATARFTITTGLKVAPPWLKERELARLYDAGFTEQELGFPDPRRDGGA